MPRRGKNTEADAACIVRATLFGVDEGWFDAYWYGRREDARQRLPGRLARALCDLLDAAREAIHAWSAGKARDYRFMTSLRTFF